MRRATQGLLRGLGHHASLLSSGHTQAEQQVQSARVITPDVRLSANALNAQLGAHRFKALPNHSSVCNLACKQV